MDWLLANWFWILIFILFVGMHLFGHGGHGGHGGYGGSHRQRDKDEGERDGRIVNESSGGHQH